MKRIVNALYKFGYERRALVILVLCAAAAIALPAQTLTKIHTFCLSEPCLDGTGPNAPLVEAVNGDLYGTTVSGGAESGSSGTFFKIAFPGTAAGQLTTIYSFCSLPGCADGGSPSGGLVQAKSSPNLYGITSGGGANPGPDGYGAGTVYEITPQGKLTTLYSFCSKTDCADGYQPHAGLVQATNGDYYGSTFFGGAHGGGTIFKITAAGALTTLHNFCAQSGCVDGAGPYGALVQGNDGNLYGTTVYGGSSPYLSTLLPSGQRGGTVFRITPQGKLTTLYSFCSAVSGDTCTDGEDPVALIKGIDGSLYGTTELGGYETTEIVGANPGGAGTIYKITPSGVFETFYNFCSQISQGECKDGENPDEGLAQANDGNLYGTTLVGGAGDTSSPITSLGAGGGTIYKITLDGVLTTLYDFCADGIQKNGCTDGLKPETLVQATNGNFYGTAVSLLRANGDGLTAGGEIFRFPVGLAPFVETVPASGATGSTFKIVGTNLTGATSVSFNGIAAEFKVASKTEINATVPAGATSGTVQVITPSATLDSNAPFEVLP